MVRHTAFKKLRELNAYLAGVAPRHVYHSTAYYRDPKNRSMKEKDWLGADLIFDLDADHLQGVEGKNYPEMLAMVKVEYKKLLDFIMDDFGFEEDCLEMVFSGGRGYHLHVRSPQAYQLGSQERREIVNYITGKGLDTSRLVKKEFFEERNFESTTIQQGEYEGISSVESRVRSQRRGGQIYKGKSIKKLEIHPGWNQRIFNGILKMMDQLEELDDHAKRVKFFRQMGASKNRAEAIVKRLFKGERGHKGIDLIRKRRVDFFHGSTDKGLTNSFLEIVINKSAIESMGETDEPVTGDVHRLIRTPASLHGKSGLRVTRLATMEELDDFQPLEDAVVFSDRPVPVFPLKKASVFMKGEQFGLDEEEEQQELPEYAAVFAMGIGLAEFGGK